MLIQKISNDKERLLYELKKIGVDPYSYRMIEKGICISLKLKDVLPAEANIIKQEALASGIDAAVAKGTVNCSVPKSDVLIIGNERGILKLCEKMKFQPFGLKVIGEEISSLLYKKKRSIVNAAGKIINTESDKILAVINATPDSFSDGGSYLDMANVERRFKELIDDGINFIDIGGESTRPGANEVPLDVELERVIPLVKKAVEYGFTISVDTYKSKVAEMCLKVGAHMINDISGMTFDENMRYVCKDYNAAACIMHIKGIPKFMQNNIKYDNILEEIKVFLYESIEKGLSAGIPEDNFIIDPGFGFGKSLEDNYHILRNLKEFDIFGVPILAGVSRKSMIGKVTAKDVSDRTLGSKIVETMALLNGADIIRTHDTTEAVETVKLYNAYKGKIDCD